MNVKELTAEAILAIPKSEPHKLFTVEKLEYEMRLLRGKWHPDLNIDPKAAAVFTHVFDLHKEAETLIAADKWSGPAVFKWRSHDSSFELKYQEAFTTEYGTMYTARTAVALNFDKQYAQLSVRAGTFVKMLKYASDEMHRQFAPLFPIPRYFTDSPILVWNKTEDVLPLRLVLKYMGGTMPARHVAWIISRLQNIAAYFEYAGISHQALSVDTLFISPKFHSVLVFGGWGYAVKIGDRVREVPAALMDRYPKELLTTKEATVKTDQALIKAIGLELLGDATGTGTKLFSRMKADDIPEPMLRFLQAPPGASASRAYAEWESVLKQSWGERKFIPLEVEASHVYMV